MLLVRRRLCRFAREQARPFGLDGALEARVIGAFGPQMLQDFVLACRLRADEAGGARVARGDIRPQQEIEQRIGLGWIGRVARNRETVDR